MVQHTLITLPSKAKGCHLITAEVLRQVQLPEEGLLHLFIQHTSAALTIQENASAEVLSDLDRALDRLAPQDPELYTHTEEGPDDMPSHVKAALCGSSVSVPVSKGKLLLGRWQGLYLLEFRTHASPRTLVATVWT